MRPGPVAGCHECHSFHGDLFHAGAELRRAKRALQRASDDRIERCVAEGKAARAWVNRATIAYDAHHADAHAVTGPGGVVLPRTDNHRGPTHQKPVLPPAADLAARLRAGETLDDLAAAFDRTAHVLARKISWAGFNSRTGVERGRVHDDDGVAAFAQWRFPPFVDRALCAQTDPEMFFPDKGGSTSDAKKVCNGDPARGVKPCPVRDECLQWALDNDERFGIYGGLSERERRKLRKAAS